MPLTRIQPQGLDSTGTYTFNGIIANTAIVAGNDISSGGGPKITNIQVTDSSYNVLDDTSVSTSGGYIKITGTGFASGCQVLINNIPVTSVTFVSATEVRAQVPATSAGTYVVYLVNGDGGVAIRVNGITFSGTPNWVTSSTLPNSDPLVSIQLSATSDSAVVYSLAAGSTLPTGITLSSGGLLSGTVPSTGADQTTYNFTINAIDVELQDSPRTFSITITFSDLNFPYVTTLISANTATLPYDSDASNNSFAITPNGDVRPNGFNPYTPGYYSNFFDGSGDNTSVATNAAFTLGANDFSFEAWIYPVSITNTSAVIASQWGLSDSEGIWQLGITSNNFYFSYDTNGSVPTGTITISTTGGILFNQWHHVLVTRVASGGNSITRLFINGVLRAYNSVSTYSITSSSSPIRLGMQGYTTYRNGEPFHGYISNFRFVNGSVPTSYLTSATTVDTVVFTPSTVPLTTTSQGATESQVELLLAQSNRFIDNSTNNFTVTRNGDTLVSGFDPFVPNTSYSTYGSGYFDGTGDWLVTTTSPATLSGNFTIEGWVYITSLAANRSLVCIGDDNTSTGALFFVNTSGRLGIYGNGGNILIGTSQTVVVNTWNHIAFVRSSGTITAYLNGVADSTAASNSTAFTGANRIGGELFAGNAGGTIMLGYISNYRLVNGTAVYTSAFTPPTTPLTAISNTSLLTLQTNQPDNNNILLDSSTNDFLVTRNGNTTQGTFSPYGPLWSNYFDGGTNRLTTSTSSLFNLTGSSITLECWVYMSSAPSVYNRLITIGPNNAQSSLYLGITTGRVLEVSVPFGSGGGVTSGANLIPLNTWTHLAFVLSGSTGTIYINGTQVGQSGSWNITSTSSNYFYIGYDATATVDGKFTGYISNVRLLVGTALYTSAFTPSTTPLQAVANTRILTCQSRNIIDNSANNFTLTVVGAITIQRFSPFSPQTANTFYSGYFDGTGDYLSLASNTAFAAPGDFTVEFWVNTPTTASSQVFYLVNATNGLIVYVTANKVVIRSFGIANLLTSSIDMPLNQWVHIAAARSGTTLSLWINGSRSNGGTVTNSTSFAQGELRIGNNEDVTIGTIGYISNVRFVKGTAVYDPAQSSITVPTSPLTAIANTSLLTCQSATFVDNSTNNFTITVNGNSRPTTVAPFTPTSTTGVSYSPSVYGGSMYFDGSGDYLTVPPSTTTYLSNRAFTIEAWVYLNANDVILVSRRAAVSARGFFFSYGNVTNNKFSFNAGDTDVNAWNVQLTSTDTFSLRQWHHVAITRNSSNVFTLWVNGISQATGTASFTIADDTSNLLIGAIDSGNGPMNGYISNLRIITGQALYTSNFAPPVSPLTAIQNSVLLLNGTSAGVYDSSMMNDYETVGNSNLVTSIKKYGNSSLYFDGTGDWINIVSTTNNLFAFGTGNFTIEFWFYGISVAGGLPFDFRPLNTNGAYPSIYLSAGQLRYYVNTADRITGGSLSTSTWYHIAVCRSGTSTKMFLDGTQIGSTYTDSADYLTANVPLLGASGFHRDGTGAINGYIDDFRVTKGVARYTANFTPTTSTFQTK